MNARCEASAERDPVSDGLAQGAWTVVVIRIAARAGLGCCTTYSAGFPRPEGKQLCQAGGARPPSSDQRHARCPSDLRSATPLRTRPNRERSCGTPFARDSLGHTDTHIMQIKGTLMERRDRKSLMQVNVIIPTSQKRSLRSREAKGIHKPLCGLV